MARNWGLNNNKGRTELKRAFIQVPYAVLSRLLFDGHRVGIYRIEKDKPGPNGYVEFIVYADEKSEIERGSTYQLYLNKNLQEIGAESSNYQRKKK